MMEISRFSISSYLINCLEDLYLIVKSGHRNENICWYSLSAQIKMHSEIDVSNIHIISTSYSWINNHGIDDVHNFKQYDCEGDINQAWNSFVSGLL